MSFDFDGLQKDAVVAGFRAEAVYKNGQDKGIGGRFVHEKSGFTLDLLEIQSVPQAYLCVKTFPTSNMGEPHTQEHLLLGKGNVGRATAAAETMSLVTSTAFTQQLKTCYPFNTTAGREVFFASLGRNLNAMLHPDYTDEEIRREVRNFGVKERDGGQLELEEKGTIYAEMVSATTQPGYRVYRAMGRLVFGPEHPMSFDSGGDPKYIREMQPRHIRDFHAANYYLGNMEMVASLPKGGTIEETLQRFNETLTRLQGEKAKRKGNEVKDLPAPRPVEIGTMRVVEFPARNAQQPGPASFSWPARPVASLDDQALAEVFADAVGGDPSTNFYKLFVDSKTRKMDLGARSVAMGFDNEAYARFSVYVPDLAPGLATEEKLGEIRAALQGELKRISGWADGSGELKEFHARIEANLTRTKRSLDKLTSSPPGFGARSGSSMWPGLLEELERVPGFEKSVVQRDLIARLEAIVRGEKNIWREKLAEWRLLDTPPYVVAAKASPELIAKEEAEYKERIAAEVARLKEQYQVSEEQEAIRRYKKEYDEATAELERAEAQSATAKFIDQPPLSLDEQLDYSLETLNGAPYVTGRFAGMNSATVGVALNVKEWKGRELIYAAILPGLLTGSGVTKDGQTLSFEEMTQRVRREILSLSAYYSTNPVTGRMEMVVSGSGNNLAEAKAAVGWMEAALLAPNWRSENAARVRDQVDQTINALRTTMQRSEETWVNNPSSAWVYQDDPLYLSVNSFLTRLFHLHRLRWMLRDAGSEEEKQAVLGYLGEVEQLSAPSKEALEAAAGKLDGEAKKTALEAARDLAYLAADLPATSRARDWKYLIEVTRKDYLEPAATALAGLDAGRMKILKRENARFFVTGSPENSEALKRDVAGILTKLSEKPMTLWGEKQPRQIAKRVMAREKQEREPVFVALTAPNMQGGVFLNSAPFVKLNELDEESALQFLASKLYAGGGPHGVFMKTWGAGLAYSNGLRSSAGEGRISYYAERTPELPQTLQFVIGELKNAPREKPLAEYALSQVFAQSRADGSFEGRTSAMAEDLADGNGPEKVRAFREAVLKVRGHDKLDELLYARMDEAYGKVLPGYNGKVAEGASYYVIGPEKQLAAWEAYLKKAYGPATRLERLTPRDYWVPVD